MSSNGQIKILFLAADPSNATRLRLGQELRDIREKLQLAKERDRFILDSRESVRPGDISQAIFDVEPQIVHFSGHGTSTGELCFEDLLGKYQPVKPDALAALFELVADQINCVVLNACYSEAQAKAIAQHIPFVIGMNKAIGDQAAIAFAVGFYKALAARRTIDQANVRIYEVAKELNVDNQHLLSICKSLGIQVASHLNMISTSDVQRVHTAFRDYATSGQSFDFSSEFIPKTETLKDEIISHKRLDPSRLQDLLAVGRWQEADQETEQLIIQIADAERQGLLSVEELKNLSCHDLRVIDRLWVEYSNGHFGFSVQKKIWESFGFTNNIRDYNIWCNFGNSVGWRVKDRWLPYERIKFTFQAPKGHLPFFRAWIGMRKTGLVYSMHQVNRFHAFMYRCGSCNLTQE